MLGLLFCALLMVFGAGAAERAPNIVRIYADDLGYGI
jgi:hypothetical protein